MKIAIVDDEKRSIETLSAYLTTFCRKNKILCHITEFYDGKELLQQDTRLFDSIFMDIDMKDVNGLDAARKMRETDADTILVFVTQMAQYAVDGYKVDALDYLVKPVDYYAFELVFRKICKRLKMWQAEQVVLNIKDEIHILKRQDILYIEIIDHYLTYHTKDAAYRCKGSLEKAALSLEGSLFYRCHRCFLVNVRAITGIDNESIWIGQQRIEVSRARRKGLIQAVGKELGGEI